MLFVLLLSIAIPAADPATARADTANSARPAFTVHGCPLEYKPEAKAAYFNAIVKYRLSTDAAGFIVSVTEDAATTSPPPFRPVLDPLTRCLKTWKLESHADYVAELRWGHGVFVPVWTVCRLEGGCLDLVVKEQ